MKDMIINRRSIRKYTNYKISDEEILEILEVAQRAPSTQNLQPWRFFIIGSLEAKNKLRKSMSYNLTQLDTSSHMILLTLDPLRHQKAPIIFDRAVEKGIMPKEVRDKQVTNILNNPPVLDDPGFLSRLYLDAGLVSMNLMLAAKAFGYDTNAIGGFDKTTVNENLGIDKNLIPALLISIGKADETGYQSVRLTTKETTKFIK